MAISERVLSEWLLPSTAGGADSDGPARAPSHVHYVAPLHAVESNSVGAELAVHTNRNRTKLPKATSTLPSTQLLLRKTSAGQWQVFLDGRHSDRGAELTIQKDEGSGAHVQVTTRTFKHELPPFREESMLIEEDTNRKIPAPVMCGCLIEEGACAPSLVRVQIVQRTYVRNVQVDIQQEPVLAETDLTPFTASEPMAKCVLLPYPSHATRAPTFVVVDDERGREEFKRNNSKELQGIITALVAGRAILAAKRASQYARYFEFAYFTLLTAAGTLVAMTGGPSAIGFALAFGTPLVAMVGGRKALEFIAGYVKRSADAKRKEAGQSTDEEKEAKGFKNRIEIAMGDLPGLIRRLVAYNTDSLTQSGGRPLTVEDHKRAKRFDDAAMLSYMTYAFDPNNGFLKAEIEMLNRLAETVEATTEDGQPTDDAREAIAKIIETRKTDIQNANTMRQKFNDVNADNQLSSADLAPLDAEGVKTMIANAKAAIQKITDQTHPNELDLTFLGKENLYASNMTNYIRVEIVDNDAWNGEERAPARQVHIFDAREDVAFRAGWFSSGYEEACVQLEQILENIKDPFAFGAERDRNMPIFYAHMSTHLTAQIADMLSSYNVDIVQANREIAQAVVKATIKDVLNAVKWVREDMKAEIDNITDTDEDVLVRRLPHVCKVQRAMSASARLPTGDGNVDFSAGDSPWLRIIGPLNEALKSANASARSTRNVLSYFQEQDGTARERMRFLICYKQSDDVRERMNNYGREIAPTKGTGTEFSRSIDSRLVYAPRMPISIAEATLCYSKHRRHGEETQTAWMADAPQKSLLSTMGVPSTHTGELLVGAYAHLVCEDLADRFNDKGLYDPRPMHLMRMGTVSAADRLRRASALGNCLLRARRDTEEPPDTVTRLPDEDAFFEAYPGGADLRLALNECSEWRSWNAFWQHEWKDGCKPTSSPLDQTIAAYLEAPRSSNNMVNIVRAMSKIKSAPSDAKDDLGDWYDLPHLCAQSMLGVLSHPSEYGHPLGVFEQVDHARRALYRLVKLAKVFGLMDWDDNSVVALLMESAHARPILEIVHRMVVTNTAPEPLRTLCNKPISFGSDYFQQVTDSPLRAQWSDAARPLYHRLRSLRLANLDEGEASDAFARMRLNAQDLEEPETYRLVVPFSGASIRDVSPTMSRAFEEAPIFFELTPTVNIVVDSALDVVKGSRSVRLVPMLTSGATNPFEIEATKQQTEEGATNVVVRFTMCELSKVYGAQPAATLDKCNTLDKLTTRLLEELGAQTASKKVLGNAVDAASAILWNVERMLQAMLIGMTMTYASEADPAEMPPVTILLDMPPKRKVLQELAPAPSLIELDQERIDSYRKQQFAAALCIYDNGQIGERLAGVQIDDTNDTEKARGDVNNLFQELENMGLDELRDAFVESAIIDEEISRADWDALESDKKAREIQDKLEEIVDSKPTRKGVEQEAENLKLAFGHFKDGVEAVLKSMAKHFEEYAKLKNEYDCRNNERQKESERVHRLCNLHWRRSLQIAASLMNAVFESPPAFFVVERDNVEQRMTVGDVDVDFAEALSRKFVAPLCEVCAALAATCRKDPEAEEQEQGAPA
jgi:hypothetical protein